MLRHLQCTPLIVFALLLALVASTHTTVTYYDDEVYLWARNVSDVVQFLVATQPPTAEEEEMPPIATLKRGDGTVEGWDYIRITTPPPTKEQSASQLYFAAGFLEGYVTAQSILDALHNSVTNTTLNNECVRRVVGGQLASTRTRAVGGDRFGDSVLHVLRQLEGMLRGVFAATGFRVSMDDLFMLNMGAEVEQIDRFVCGRPSRMPFERSVGFIKKTKKDLLIGHATHAPYRDMLLRQVKSYHIAASPRLLVSGYPGRVTSTDDFAVVDFSFAYVRVGLTHTGDSIVEGQVSASLPQFIRVAAGGDAALSAHDFLGHLSLEASPAANAEFIVIDVRRSAKFVLDGSPLPIGTVWLLEQLNGQSTVRDLSLMVNTLGFFIDVGLPTVTQSSNVSSAAFAQGPTPRWTNARSRLLAAHADHVNTASGVVSLLRRNRWRSDGQSWCANVSDASCVAPSPVVAIAPRADLNPTVSDRLYFGAIDAKATSIADILRSTIVVQAGPAVHHPDTPPVDPQVIAFLGLRDLSSPVAQLTFAKATFVVDPSSHPPVVQSTMWHPPLSLALLSAVVLTAMVAGVALAKRRVHFVQERGYTPLA